MIRVALFGGAFDPPHIGHVISVTNILNSGLIDELWFIPSGDSRYDKRAEASAGHRAAMLKLVIGETFGADKRLSVSTIQFEGSMADCATIDLWDALRTRHPEREFSFVIGSDNIPMLAGWRNPERLIAEVTFLVLVRPGVAEPPPMKNGHLTWVEESRRLGAAVSSSNVRELIRAGRRVHGIVPAEVKNYIRRESLYV